MKKTIIASLVLVFCYVLLNSCANKNNKKSSTSGDTSSASADGSADSADGSDSTANTTAGQPQDESGNADGENNGGSTTVSQPGVPPGNSQPERERGTQLLEYSITNESESSLVVFLMHPAGLALPFSADNIPLQEDECLIVREDLFQYISYITFNGEKVCPATGLQPTCPAGNYEVDSAWITWLGIDEDEFISTDDKYDTDDCTVISLSNLGI